MAVYRERLDLTRTCEMLHFRERNVLYGASQIEKGERSVCRRSHPCIYSTLPDDVDTPLRWLVEGAKDEFGLLDGTMVGMLSRMMHSQVRHPIEKLSSP